VFEVPSRVSLSDVLFYASDDEAYDEFALTR
jgi:hypothetical protein